MALEDTLGLSGVSCVTTGVVVWFMHWSAVGGMVAIVVGILLFAIAIVIATPVVEVNK